MRQKPSETMKSEHLGKQKHPMADIPGLGDKIRDLVKTHPGGPIRLMEQKHFVFRQGLLQVPKVDFDEWFDASDGGHKGYHIAWLDRPLKQGEIVVVAAIDGSWYWRWDSGTGQINQSADVVAEPTAEEVAAVAASVEKVAAAAAAEKAAAIEEEVAAEKVKSAEAQAAEAAKKAAAKKAAAKKAAAEKAAAEKVKSEEPSTNK